MFVVALDSIDDNFSLLCRVWDIRMNHLPLYSIYTEETVEPQPLYSHSEVPKSQGVVYSLQFDTSSLFVAVSNAVHQLDFV